MLANTDDPTKYATNLLTIVGQYKYTPQLLTLRSLVLSYRDFLIAVLRFFQVLTDFTIDVTNASTEVKAQKEVALAVFQETVVALTGLAQSLVAILGESFMQAIETAVELFMMFVSALYSLIQPGGASTAGNKMIDFFERFFIETKKVFFQLSKGLMTMFFKGPFKTIWDGLCVGINLIQQASKALVCERWIPVGLKVGCRLPDGDISAGELNEQHKCIVKFSIGLTHFPEFMIPPPAPPLSPAPPPIDLSGCYEQHAVACTPPGLYRGHCPPECVVLFEAEAAAEAAAALISPPPPTAEGLAQAACENDYKYNIYVPSCDCCHFSCPVTCQALTAFSHCGTIFTLEMSNTRCPSGGGYGRRKLLTDGVDTANSRLALNDVSVASVTNQSYSGLPQETR
jgi:hypothetical protein